MQLGAVLCTDGRIRYENVILIWNRDWKYTKTESEVDESEVDAEAGQARGSGKPIHAQKAT